MKAGEVTGGRFRVGDRIGAGGMATIYQADDLETGAVVALKVHQYLEGFADPGQLERFDREAELLAGLDHPGIVRYTAHGTGDGMRWLAMEWLAGEDLASRLRRGPLPVGASLRLAEAVADALGYAHERGVVHRDLKPANVFLVGGDLERPKILDFGVARPSRSTDLTRTGVRVGTPAFMAPEQVRGERRLDERVDIFALGCLLYTCIAGRSPFQGEDEIAVYMKILLEDPLPLRDVSPLGAGIDAELEQLVGRLLARDPEQRPRNGREAAAAIGKAARHESPPVAPDVALTERERRLASVVLVRPADPDEATTIIVGEAPTPTPRHDRSTLGTVVGRQGGIVERLLDGSWVLALAGTGRDQAAQAARCALEIRRLMPEADVVLATARVQPGRGLLGDAAERTARSLRQLERAGDALPHPILVDDVSAGLLDSRFVLRGTPVGLALVGEQEVVEVDRILLGKATPCVGRDRELSMLETEVDGCDQDAAARAVLVTAPPGAGKSRLRHELTRRLTKRDNPPQLWVCRGDALAAGSPLGLLAPMLRRSAGILDDEPPAAQQQKLRARFSRNLAPEAAVRVAEFLGEAIGIPAGDDASVQLRAARRDAALMADQLLRAWLELVEAECSEQLLILVLEDLHWGDAATVKLIDAALRQLHDRPLLVIAFARPDVHQVFPRLWNGRPVTEIKLSELSKRACERLVREFIPGAADALVGRIVEMAGGNAFYLEELIRTASSDTGQALPETVLAVAQARLESVPPDARRMLRAAAVFGGRFWRGGVEALCADTVPERVGELLGELERAELIERRFDQRFGGAEELVFRHALVREAAYDSLTEHDRALGHRLAADWLVRQGEAQAVVLAEHYERGGVPERAAGWYRRAAEQALAANDIDGALHLAGRGLDTEPPDDARGALELIRAEAHGWRGELVQAHELAGVALAALPAGSELWWRAAGEYAVFSGSLARYDELVAMVEGMRAAASTEAGERGRLIASARAAAVLFMSGRYPLAERFLAELDEDATRLMTEDPALAGCVLWARGWRSTYRGDLAGALACRAAAAQRFEEAGDRRSACQQRVMLGSVYCKVGLYAEAVEVLQQARADARRMNLANVLAQVNNNLGNALAHLGQLEEGLAVEREAISAYRAMGNLRMEAGSRGYLVRFLVNSGRLDQAEDEARAAVAAAVTTPPSTAICSGHLARVLIARGLFAEALPIATQALGLVRELGGLDEDEAMVRLAHLDALIGVGRVADAEQALLDAHSWLLRRAELIADPAVRRGFLERHPDHAQIIQRAAALRGGAW